MKKDLTIKKLQNYIKSKDHDPKLKHAYFMKLVEEVGEVGRVIMKNDFKGGKFRLTHTGNIKDTLEEELYDVIYYVVALANVYDIDLEKCFYLKEEINKKKYKN